MRNDIAISILMHTKMAKYSRTVFILFTDLQYYCHRNILPLKMNFSQNALRCKLKYQYS
jgi:hypothetical protein